MEEDYLKKLVSRYLSKKSTDEELEIFVHLMKQGKLDQQIQEAMDSDIEENLQNVQQLERKKRFNLLRWPIAAAITFIFCLFTYNLLHPRQPDAIAKIRTIKINNHYSTIYKQILPDGSIVWLNPNTYLSYPAKFGKLREVNMEGEAFFEVTKDHLHPFQITSGNVLTRVWGTSFRIRSIPGENSTKISVLTGKVSVSIKDKGKLASTKMSIHQEVMLLPQEQATCQQSNQHLVKAPIPVSELLVWHKSNLSFENTKMMTVAAELSKYYHMQISVEGEKLNQYQLTADFNDKNLADILILLSKSVHTTYAQNENKITLRTTIK